MTEYTSWDKEPVSSFLDRLFANFLILDYHGSIYGRRSLCVDFDNGTRVAPLRKE